MLHLGLAGNVFCAIGGAPKVYGEKYTPIFPVNIFYEDKVKLELKPATKENIHTFVKLEEPIPEFKFFALDANILPEYHSIGEFYEATLTGLKILYEKYKSEGKELFDPKTISKQFQTADGSWYDDDMTVIHDLDSAVKAMTIIIEQGEGSTGQSIKNTVQSHYQVFKELYDEHPLICYPIVENPVTENFKDETIYKVMVACDAAYCYLLLTIEKMWIYDGPSRGRLVTNNIMNLMLTVLRPFALFLVTQPLKDGKNAAPPFNLYKFDEKSSAFEQLKVLTSEALNAYPNATELKPVERAVNDLIDISKL